MKLSKPSIPKELDADVAISVIIPHMEAVTDRKLSCRYEFKGAFERTALGDNVSIRIRNKQNLDSSILFSLKRDSLYHILPEFLFHSLDHYLNTEGDVEEFDKRYNEKEDQKNKALTYFNPFDQYYQHLRTNYQQWLNEHIFKGNQFLADFITNGYEVNLKNPFIKAVYSSIPWLRDFRGNDDMVTTALEYAFNGHVEIKKKKVARKVKMSNFIHTGIDGTISDLYCGTTFCANLWHWEVFYHTKIETSKDVYTLRLQIQEFSEFFLMWFLSVETELNIEFGDIDTVPYLSEIGNEKGVFLNYSTQLI